MTNTSALLYVLIVGCEVAFWLVLLLALAVRYLLRREPLSRALLFALPAIDVLLLVFTAVDLKAGAAATSAHGLATAYVGFTVAFGRLAVAWADRRFAHHFAGGPPPIAAPSRGWPAIEYELRLWLRSIVAWIIAMALLAGLIAYVNDEARTQALEEWYRIAFGSVAVWFAFGPVWALVFGWRKAGSPSRAPDRSDRAAP